jgi:hypothetical protein
MVNLTQGNRYERLTSTSKHQQFFEHVNGVVWEYQRQPFIEIL